MSAEKPHRAKLIYVGVCTVCQHVRRLLYVSYFTRKNTVQVLAGYCQHCKPQLLREEP